MLDKGYLAGRERTIHRGQVGQVVENADALFGRERLAQVFGGGLHHLVAPAAEVHEHHVVEGALDLVGLGSGKPPTQALALRLYLGGLQFGIGSVQERQEEQRHIVHRRPAA